MCRYNLSSKVIYRLDLNIWKVYLLLRNGGMIAMMTIGLGIEAAINREYLVQFLFNFTCNRKDNDGPRIAFWQFFGIILTIKRSIWKTGRFRIKIRF